VPTMWIQGLWDQEDIWGAVHSYAAVEPKDAGNDKNFLVMGPWRHSQVNYNGTTLGPMTWRGDTALEFRRDVLKPFFDQYLKDGAPKASTPPVFIYNTGENHWDRFPSWPLACESGCATASKPLYLTSGFGLSRQQGSAATPGSAAGYDEYVSDPAKPVPFIPRPARFADGDAWHRWLLMDQRFVADRPDVLSYVTPVLAEPVRVSGAPVVHLVASTSGTDADWVVKLIPTKSRASPRWAATSSGSRWTSFAAGIARASRRRRRFRRIRRCRSRSRCPPRTTSSCPATASWCRCSRRGSRCTTATRRPSCRMSSLRRLRTIRRPRFASTTPTEPQALLRFPWCL
jgi:putative CocE/NonD family hydrolase